MPTIGNQTIKAMPCESCGMPVVRDDDGGYGCASCGHVVRPDVTPVTGSPRDSITFFLLVWGRVKAAVDKAVDEWLRR